MSTFEVKVVSIDHLYTHENADSLSIVKVFGENGFPVIVKTSDFIGVDKGCYIPVDSICPNTPEFEFLGKSRRVRAKKLRGIYSEGILIPAKTHWKIGDNVAGELGVKKYEEPEPIKMQTDDEPMPTWFQHYTDIENFRKYPDIIQPNEQVIVTEKVHGACSAFVFKDNRLYVFSHRKCKKFNKDNLWWRAAIQYSLEEKLKNYQDYIFYAETYGNVQDLKYNHDKGKISLVFFDILHKREYVDYMRFIDIMGDLNLPIAPKLYEGCWNVDLLKLAETNSDICPDQLMEGIVIRPRPERYHPVIRRVILKVVSQRYLLRKGGSENH